MHKSSPRRFWVLLSSLSLLVLVGMVAAAPVRAERWIIECVDCAKFFYAMDERCLQLDSAGHPRIAYGGDQLYYAWHDGTAWHYETVDGSPDVGAGASLALDAGGRPAISYYDARNKDLKFAIKEPSGWHVQVVDSQGVVGASNSLAVDQTGKVHIAYTDDSPAPYGSLKYAYQDAAGWHIEKVDRRLWLYSGYVSLALDASGHPHISYHAPNKDETWQVLKYATRDDGWHGGVVDGSQEVGEYSSLVVDPSGEPHISYYDRLNHKVKYAYRQGDAWHLEIVDGTMTWGSYSSLALAEDGNPHIGYLQRPNSATYEVRYAQRDAAGWHVVTVVSGEDEAWSPSLALDAEGHATIGFLDSYDYYPKPYNRTLKMAHWETDGWHVDAVDKEGNPGNDSSLALDGEGHPHLSYNDWHGRRLVYTHQTPAGWQMETVPAQGWMPYDISLAVDGRGYPHLSYVTDIGELIPHYAYRDDSGWHSEAVDPTTGSRYGTFPSLALARDDTPRIGYYHPLSETLKFAYRDEEGWHPEAVDGAESDAIWDISLALDSEEQPHMSYYDEDDHVIKYAWRDHDGWHVETLDAVDLRGSEAHITSLALDKSGDPHIAYYAEVDPENNGLRYATRDEAGWHKETVEAGNKEGRFVSLGLDEYDRAHIAYQEGYPDYNLKYAVQDAAGWQIEWVDTAGDVGEYPSLVLDKNGVPHISYRDDTRFGVKYAYAWFPSHFVYLPLVERH